MSLTPAQLAAKWSLPLSAFTPVLRTDITLDFLTKRIAIGAAALDVLDGGAIYFGDSLANNFAHSPAVGAAGWAKGADLGLPGDTCAMMQYRLQAEPGYDFSGITAANCYATIVQAMTNDVGKTSDDPATIVDRGLAVIATLYDRAPVAPIFVMALYPRGPRFAYPLDGGRIAAINTALHEIDAARNWPFRLIDVDLDIHAACDPEFAANPDQVLCSIYQDETHVGAPVYAAAIAAIKGAYVNPIPWTPRGGRRTSRQLGAQLGRLTGSRSLTGAIDG